MEDYLIDKITHKIRREQWTNIIKEYFASGMNKTNWCREYGISDKAFFYWQRRLCEEVYVSTIESSSSTAVKPVSMPADPSVDFVDPRLPKTICCIYSYPHANQLCLFSEFVSRLRENDRICFRRKAARHKKKVLRI